VEFARLHGAASGLFMLTAVLGLLLVAVGRVRADQKPEPVS